MASDRLRIVLAQANPTVGDLDGNLRIARGALAMGEREGAHLVALPRMFLAGHPVGLLAARPAFLRDCREAVEELASATRPGGPAIGVGAPAEGRGGVLDAWVLCQDGGVRASFARHHGPHSQAFDENPLFRAGAVSGPVEIGGVRIGFPVGADLQQPDVAETLQEAGAEMLLVPAASPYSRGGMDERILHGVARSVETRLPILYLNLVGGQDESVFDGGSFALNPGGRLAARMPLFEEACTVVEIERGEAGVSILRSPLPPEPEALEQDWHAMVTGLRDYVRKSGFSKALLGLSGGVDSALVATLAADALGPENLRCVRLPSRHSSDHGLEDAAALAAALGCRLDTIPIEGAVSAVEQGLAPLFAGTARGVAEENVQARVRGLMLMALSNKFGELLLATGNKSEAAVGYATIYGDTNGAFNPVKDLWKTAVYACAAWRNANHRPWMKAPPGPLIPGRVLTKPPSAELRPGQKDADTLPPYDVLDPILARLVEDGWSTAQLAAAGHDIATVQRVQDLIRAAEWKRFQSAPGVALAKTSVSREPRHPIVNNWRDLSGGGGKGPEGRAEL